MRLTATLHEEILDRTSDLTKAKRFPRERRIPRSVPILFFYRTANEG